MNRTVRYNGQSVPTNSLLRSELRKAGIPVFSETRRTVGRVGYVHSNRRKVRTTHKSGIEAIQYSLNPSVLIQWNDGWNTTGHDFTAEQISSFITKSIEIAKSLGFEVRNREAN